MLPVESSQADDAVELVQASLALYAERCVRVLVVGGFGSGKTTFCEALFNILDTNGQVSDPIALSLKAHWADTHSKDANTITTTVPSARMMRLRPREDDQKNNRYLLLIDMPGSWFETDEHRQFVHQAAAAADVWVVMSDFRGTAGSARTLVELLDQRGRDRMPYVSLLATHCDGRHRSNKGEFDLHQIEQDWGKYWADVMSSGMDGLVIPKRLAVLGARYGLPLYELIHSDRRDDLFQRLSEILAVQVQRTRTKVVDANADGMLEADREGCEALSRQMSAVLAKFGVAGLRDDVWNELRVSASGVGIVLTGYDSYGNYVGLGGFVEVLKQISEYLLLRPRRDVGLPNADVLAVPGMF